MSPVRSWLFRAGFLVVFALSGCNCGGDPVQGDGGNNDDGGNNGDGGNNTGDGGDNGDGGNTGDGGNNGDGGVVGDGGACDTYIPPEVACAGKCGPQPNGCSEIHNCSAANGGIDCGAGTTCGGSACVPVVDGGPVCPVGTPTTCETLGHECGAAYDGCSQQLDCWPQGQTACPNGGRCLPDPGTGVQRCVAGTVTCNGPLCDDVPNTCNVQTPTRLTGTVVTPGIDPPGGGVNYINRVPVPNAVVYIPADPNGIPAIGEGVTPGNNASCGRCADEVFVTGNQSVLASAITNAEGDFELSGRIPIGTAFNIVIKVGKWRRVVQIPAVANCGSLTNLTVEQTRLSAHSTDGQPGTHIPRIAISTGSVDEMECVFRNIGIAQSEFTLPSGSGRIHMYHGNGAKMSGATCLGNTTWGGGTPHACSDSRDGLANYGCHDFRDGCAWSNDEAPLYDSAGHANQYDMVVMDCQGTDNHIEALNDTQRGRIASYVNNGGRLFASHWEYRWVQMDSTLDDSADWDGEANGGTDSESTAYISLLDNGAHTRARANAVKSEQFVDWLDGLSALYTTTPATIRVEETRDLAGDNVGASTDEWVFRYAGNNNTSPRVQQLSFNTPYGATPANICGRVAYSGFHVAGADNNDSNDNFPGVCSNSALSAQELVLVYMLFDLNACVSTGDPVTPPMCTPLEEATECTELKCGYISDGCGDLLNCGGCPSQHYCSGNTCLPIPQCNLQTCASLGYVCGVHPDTCGGIADNAMGNDMGCGTCPPGSVCGPNGTCVASCMPNPNPCGQAVCGTASDGCGMTMNCGTCPPNLMCISGACTGIVID